MRPQADLIGRYGGVNWLQKRVSTVDPAHSQLQLDDGSLLNYDYLIVAPGCQYKFDRVEGLKEAIEDPNSPVCSIYTLNGAYKTSLLRENFKGGKAIFTGALKPIYLFEESTIKSGVRD